MGEYHEWKATTGAAPIAAPKPRKAA